MLVGADSCQYLQAPEAGEHQVEDDDVGLHLARQLESGQPVTRLSEEIPLVERRADELAERRLVVADQNRLSVVHRPRFDALCIGLLRWPHERVKGDDPLFSTIARFTDTAVDRASLEGIFGLMRPVIGITTYAEEASWGGWTEPAAFTPLAYVRAVEQAGGRPLLVPPTDNAIEETLDVLDGVIFSGGGDIDPDAYGADVHPETQGVVAE